MSIEEIIRGEARKNLSPSSSEEVALKEESNKTPDDQYKPQLVQVPSQPLESVEPVTDIRGMTGAVTRGLTVPASQALAGAIIGSPLGPPGMLAGAAAGPIVLGLGDLAIEGVNAYFGTDFQTSRGAITHLLDSLGTPKPDTAAERVTEAVTEGLTSSGGSAKLFGKTAETIGKGILSNTLSKISPKEIPKITKAAEFFAERPVEQLIAGGVSAGASSTAQEMGAGPIASPIIGIASGLSVPMIRGGFRAIRPTQEMKEERALERLRGLYQEIIPEESQRSQIVQQLRQYGKASDQDVQLMAGDITGNEAILALQKAMESSSQKVAERRAQNIAGVGKKIGKTLEDTGVKPEETVKFFESELSFLKKIKDEAEESLKFAGSDISEEFNIAKKAVDDAEKAYQEGLITSQDAYQKSKSALDNYFEIESQKVSDRRMGELSTQTSDVIENQKIEAKKYANLLYNEIPNVKPFVQPNTKKAIDSLIAKTPEGEKGIKNIPKIIRDIYANISDENGNLKLKELWEPVDWRQQLNDAIDKSIRSGDKKEAGKLLDIKNSIDLDLQNLETAYPQIKKANKFYAEYSDIYQSKLAEKAFKEGEDLTSLLNKYGKSEEGLINLRNAIFNHPEVSSTEAANKLKNFGLRNIDEWIVSKANEAMRKPTGDKKYTSISLKKWLTQGEGSVIFKVFGDDLKESKSTIENLISKFEDLENSAIKAKKNIDLAKSKELTQGSPVKIAYENAKISKQLVDDSIKDAQQQLVKEFNEKTNEALNPANKFIGGKNASEVIGSIMSDSKTSEENMRKLVEAASKDPSGKALEGLKNAGKKWFNKDLRFLGKSSTTKGITSPQILVENLQADLAKVQKFLIEGTPERNTIEILFGKNSKELTGLDNAQQALDMINRTTSLTASELLKRDVKPNEVLDALLTVGAIEVGQMKGFVVWKLIETMRKMGRASEKDVKNIFENLLSKSLYDPDTAAIAFQPLTKESWPATKQLAKNLGITVRATDFGLEEEQNENSKKEKNKSFSNEPELLPY